MTTAILTPAPRVRNAAATRSAMLVSARRHFARENYENVGLREIAGDAGVDPALVCRYFGSKERLFGEAMHDEAFDLGRDADLANLPEYLADLLLSGSEAKTERLLMMLHSFSSPQASAIILEKIEDDILSPVAQMLAGEDAACRAGLCLAALMGAGIMLSALPANAMQGADPAMLRRRLIAMFEVALAE